MKRAIALLSIFALCSLALVVVAAQQAPATPRFTQQDFARLKWIEGRWKGTGGAKPFYESYRLTSPTSLEIEYFGDETFTASSGKGVVYFEGGRILHEAGTAQWSATRVTSDSVEFTPVRTASNGFTWSRRTPDAWTAVLKPSGAAEQKYELTRVGSAR